MLTQHGNDILQLSHSAGRPRSIAPLSPCSARAGRPAERRGAKVLCVTTRGVRLRSPSEPIGAHPAWVLGGVRLPPSSVPRGRNRAGVLRNICALQC